MKLGHFWTQSKARVGLLEATPLAIVCMSISVSLFPLSDACLKHLVCSYSVQQTAFLRAFCRFVALMCFSGYFYKIFSGQFFSVFGTNKPFLHLQRLIVSVASTYCFIWACKGSSLTFLYTLGYMSPLCIVLLSALFLRERVGLERWSAVVVGLLGVFVAIHPTVELNQETYMLVGVTLMGTLFAAMNKIYIRKLTITENASTIALYPNIVMMLLAVPGVCFVWQPMPWQDWVLFLLMGGAMGVSQLLVARALSLAQASLLAPLEYMTLLWVLGLDVVVFAKAPDGWTIFGALLIILSNMFIFVRSRKQGVRV